MVRNRLRLLQDCLIVWISLTGTLVLILKFPFRFTRSSDTRVLGFDEDRSSGSLDCLTQVRCEALVPTAPECRLVWDRLETQLFAELRAVDEVSDERCFVAPPMEFF